MTAPRPKTCRLILAAAVLLTLGRLLWCDFTWWDDLHTVHHNPALNPGVTWDAFKSFWAGPTASIYIPLTYSVWAALSLIARVQPDDTGITLNPQIYHAANLAVHLGGALLLFELLRRLLRKADERRGRSQPDPEAPPTPAPAGSGPGTQNPTPQGPAWGAIDRHSTVTLPALLGALFWAVHPLQVESVGWVSGLKDVLSGSLVIAVLTAFVAFRDDGRPRWYGAAVALFVLALLAKPAAMTAPLLLVLIDRFALRTPWRKGRVGGVGVRRHRRAVRGPRPDRAAAGGTAFVPTGVRPLLVGDALAFYIVKTVAPVTLTFDYGRDIETLRAGRELFVAWLLPLGVAAGTIWFYRRARRGGRPLSPLPAVGLGLFALAPLPVLGFTAFDFQGVSTVADHYMYVALLGPALIVAACVARRPRVAGAAMVLVAVLAARAAWQCPVWQDSESLFFHGLRVNPRSWSSYVNLAVLAGKHHDSDAVRRYLAAAERTAPDQPTVLVNLVHHYAADGDMPRADAMARRLIAIYDAKWVPAGWPRASAYVLIVQALTDASQPKAAEAYLREGMARDRTDSRLIMAAYQMRWKRASESHDPVR